MIRNHRFTHVLLNATILAGVGIVSTSTPVHAQITSISPFTGQYSESFESFPNSRVTGSFSALAQNTSIFSGQGSISDAQGAMAIFNSTTATFGLGTSGNAVPEDGSQALGLDVSDDVATINFNNGVSNFGAYWGAGTEGGPSEVSVDLYNVSGQSIGTETFNYNHSSTGDGLMDWHGWHSDTLIGSVSFTGFYVVTDNMQISGPPAVPENSSAISLMMCSMLSGGVALIRRRRTALN